MQSDFQRRNLHISCVGLHAVAILIRDNATDIASIVAIGNGCGIIGGFRFAVAPRLALVITELPLIGDARTRCHYFEGSRRAVLHGCTGGLGGNLQGRNLHVGRIRFQAVAVLIRHNTADITTIVFVTQGGRIRRGLIGTIAPRLALVITELPLIGDARTRCHHFEGSGRTVLHCCSGRLGGNLQRRNLHIGCIRRDLIAILVSHNATDIATIVTIGNGCGITGSYRFAVAPRLALIITKLPLIGDARTRCHHFEGSSRAVLHGCTGRLDGNLQRRIDFDYCTIDIMRSSLYTPKTKTGSGQMTNQGKGTYTDTPKTKGSVRTLMHRILPNLNLVDIQSVGFATVVLKMFEDNYDKDMISNFARYCVDIGENNVALLTPEWCRGFILFMTEKNNELARSATRQ